MIACVSTLKPRTSSSEPGCSYIEALRKTQKKFNDDLEVLNRRFTEGSLHQLSSSAVAGGGTLGVAVGGSLLANSSNCQEQRLPPGFGDRCEPRVGIGPAKTTALIATAVQTEVTATTVQAVITTTCGVGAQEQQPRSGTGSSVSRGPAQVKRRAAVTVVDCSEHGCCPCEASGRSRTVRLARGSPSPGLRTPIDRVLVSVISFVALSLYLGSVSLAKSIGIGVAVAALIPLASGGTSGSNVITILCSWDPNMTYCELWWNGTSQGLCENPKGTFKPNPLPNDVFNVLANSCSSVGDNDSGRKVLFSIVINDGYQLDISEFSCKPEKGKTDQHATSKMVPSSAPRLLSTGILVMVTSGMALIWSTCCKYMA